MQRKQASFRCRKGVYYWPTREQAKSYAKLMGYPSDRIIEYDLGWAIQLYISGPYVGLPSQMDTSADW